MAKKDEVIPFHEWKDRLTSIIDRKLGVSLDQVLEIDEDRLLEYWHDGCSPMEYFREHLANPAEPERIDLALEL